MSLRTKRLNISDDVRDENIEIYKEIWGNNKDFFEKKGFTNPAYWECLQWVPAQGMAQFILNHPFAISLTFT